MRDIVLVTEDVIVALSELSDSCRYAQANIANTGRFRAVDAEDMRGVREAFDTLMELLESARALFVNGGTAKCAVSAVSGAVSTPSPTSDTPEEEKASTRPSYTSYEADSIRHLEKFRSRDKGLFSEEETV